MAVRDIYIAHFLDRVDKKELVKAATLAGLDTVGETANSLREKFYNYLRHTNLSHNQAKRQSIKIGRLTLSTRRL
jgi:hypothetical protein